MFHFIETMPKEGEKDFHAEFWEKWKKHEENKKWRDPRTVFGKFGGPLEPSPRADSHKDYD